MHYTKTIENGKVTMVAVEVRLKQLKKRLSLIEYYYPNRKQHCDYYKFKKEYEQLLKQIITKN